MIPGFLGGLVATGPMTMAMIELHRRLPEDERDPLPPREISAEAVEAAAPSASNSTKAAFTLMSHFGYGAAAGGLYSATIGRHTGAPMSKGLIYGVAVWAISYFGLLPAVGILKSATRFSSQRNLLMLAVHLVWGIVLALFIEVLRKDISHPRGALTGSTDHQRPEVAP